MESYLTFILCGGLFFIVVMMFIGWSAISHANGVEMNVVERRATMTQNGGPTVSNLVDTMQLLIDESDATAAREASDGVLIGFLIVFDFDLLIGGIFLEKMPICQDFALA
jgi:hypothetical protein